METENNEIINYIKRNFVPEQKDISNIAQKYENV
jgi:hypothetical protein